jgi:hypothetical protein
MRGYNKSLRSGNMRCSSIETTAKMHAFYKLGILMPKCACGQKLQEGVIWSINEHIRFE